MTVHDRLKEQNLSLPETPPIGGLYTPVKVVGKLAYVSGCGPYIKGSNAKILGKVGKDLSLEEAGVAARQTALNVLSVLDHYVGLEQVKSIVKLLAFVQSAPGFNDQPKVINYASGLLNDVFPDTGGHARSAIGTNELPGNIAVEIEAIVELF